MVRTAAIVLALLVLSTASAHAADVRYIYDDAGRLSQVIDDQGNVATYTYDAVGNILSITRTTGGVAGPVVAGISPATGAQGATVDVTLSGQNLQGAAVSTDNTGITVSGVRTMPTSISATFTIGFTARTGQSVVTVTTAVGATTTSFSVTAAPPVITSLAPTSGSVTRLVTITGTGFSTTPSANQVVFNTAFATVFASTATSISTAVPPGATTGPVTVTVGGLTSNGVPFTVTPPAGTAPTITSISPNVGSQNGGQQVTVTGTGFAADTRVLIGGNPTATTTIVDATTIRATTPPGFPGVADVLVTNSGGDGRLPGGYTYLAGPPERIVGITPTAGLTNIPVNAPVTVLFTRPVDRATISPATLALTVSSNGAAVGGTIGYDQNDTLVVFRPSVNLATSTSYTLTISQAIRSVDGIPLDGPFAGSFVTAAVADTTAPTVTVSPANGATGVPFNTAVVLTFSEAINPNSATAANLTVTNAASPRSGTITVSQQNTVATFVPASPFVPGTAVTVRLSGRVTDMAGNAIVGSTGPGTDLVTTFTTAATQDLLPPVVLNVNPLNAATGINASSTVSVTFNESVNPATVNAATFRVSSGGTPVAGTFVLSNFNTVATFVPAGLLPGLAQIDVAIGPGVTDVAGNAMVAAFGSRFTTLAAVDNFQPSVIAMNPPVGATNVPLNTKVTIAFSERIDPTTVTGGSFQLFGIAGIVPTTITVAPDQLSATLTPAQPLTANATHTVVYTAAIKDIAGNPLLNPTVFSSAPFTTGAVVSDTTGPTVVSVSPASSAQGVPANAPVVLRFSEPIAATTVNAQTVVLSLRGVPVPTTITVEQGNTVVRVASANFIPLQTNTFYNLAVTTGVTDVAGNALAEPFTSGFTTGTGTDAVSPTVVTAVPALNATGVATSTPVTLTFSEPLNPATVTAARVQLTGGGVDGPIPGAFALSADGLTVTFTPDAPLFAGQLYTLGQNDVEDVAGNHYVPVLVNGFVVPPTRFTTAIAPGTDTANAPTSATVVPASTSLFANGLTVTRVTISNVSRAGSLVPNGTMVAVTAAPAYKLGSAGGTIIGGTPSADGRFRLFPTQGGAVSVFYQAPDRPDLVRGATASALVQVASVDASGAPMTLVGVSGGITLSASKAATITANPVNVLANGASTSELTIAVTDAANAAAPSGVRLAVTAAPVFAASAGGTIVGGTAAADARFRLFTTTPGGLATVVYVAPALAPGQAATAVVQVAEADGAGAIVGLLGTVTINLNGSTGFAGPQPVVLSVSPPNGASGVGTNTLVVAEFSQPLDPATVTTGTFSVNRFNNPAVAGAFSFAAGPRGPNTVVTFGPSAPLLAGQTYFVSITTGVKSAAGTPLLASSSTSFSTAFAPDTVAPAVTGVTPPDGTSDVATNVAVSLQLSEPLNASTVNAATFTLTQGGLPVSAHVSVGAGAFGASSRITLTPDQALAPGTTYTVTATTGITDVVGNPLVTSFTSTFATGTVIDTIPPSLLGISPFAGQSGAPLNSHVTLRFDEAVDPLSVTASTFSVIGPQGLVVPSVIEVAADGRTATLMPLQALTANTPHSVVVTNGITDLAGNRLANPTTASTFTTGGTPGDAAGPQVLSVSPANGATGVATNASVLVQFSESMAAGTVNEQTLVVTANGAPVAGSITFSQNNTVARWSPAGGTLAPSTLHTVTLSGGTDLAGNALSASVTSQFTTGTASDTAALTLVSLTPAAGATNVSITDPIVAVFSEPVDPSSVNVANTFMVTSLPQIDAAIPGTFSFSADRRTVTFTPSFPLFGNVFYTITLTGITDAAGNALAIRQQFFTTGMAPGTSVNALPTGASLPGSLPTLYANGQSAVKVTVTNVNRSSTLVPNGTVVAVTASPAYKLGSAGGTVVGGLPSPDPRFRLFVTDGGGFSFVYQAPSRPDLIRGVNATAVLQLTTVDAAGRPMNLLTNGSLTLVGSRTATIAANPTSLLANGLSTSDVTVTVTDPSGTPVPAGVRIGVTAQPVYVRTSAGGTIEGGTPAPDARFQLFSTAPGGVVSPTYRTPGFAPAQSGTASLQVVEADAAGNILGLLNTLDLTLNGTTGFTGPQPALVALSPAASSTGVGTNAVVVAQFSQPLDPASVTAATFGVSAGAAVAGTRTLSASARGPNTVVTFTPSAPFAPSTVFTISITTGIRGASGAALLASSSTTFSTGPGADTLGPTVVQVSPRDGQTDVPLNTGIAVQFSEPMHAVSLDAASFTVAQGGIPITGRITLGPGGGGPNRVATFLPDVALAPSTTYTVTLSAAATDAAGNPLTPFVSTFATATDVDTLPPSVTGVSPSAGQTGVPLNTAITLRFDEPVNPVTVNTSTFTLTGPFGVGVLPGTVTVSADGLTATFTPAAPLIANASHTVTYTNGITDLAGNRLSNATSFSFTAGGVPTDGSGPAVVAVSPAAGAAGVAINAPVLLQFSEPIAATSVTASSITVSAGGGPLAGNLSLEQNNTVVRWRPSGAGTLVPNALHTATVTTAVTDVAGNRSAVPFTSAFTAGAATDTTALTVVALSPPNASVNVPVTTPITVTFSEPIDPATLDFTSTFKVTGGGVNGPIPGTFSVSADRRTVTLTLAAPLFANQTHIISLSGVEDTAGNRLASSATSFTTAVAPNTNLNALPNSATVTVAPAQLYADGQTTATVTITGIARNGVPVANGTLVAVTAAPAFQLGSVGGTILGGTPNAADPRFRLFTTLNGAVTLTYQSPNRPDLVRGVNVTAFIQVASVDAAGTPIGSLGTGSLTVSASNAATISANPVNVLANGTSVSAISMVVTDRQGGPVPAGVRVAVTAQPVYVASSAGGTINGGTAAPDARFALFTTTPGGLVDLTYTPPAFAPAQTGTAVIQVAEADAAGNVLALLGTTSLTLSGSTGFTAPQPVLLSLSPANGQQQVGTNTLLVARFSQPIDPATVTPSTFTLNVTLGPVVPGAYGFSSSASGPNTVVTFGPAVPLAPNTSYSVNLTTGIRSAAGGALLAASQTTFVTSVVRDVTLPGVVQVSPPDGASGVPTNAPVSVELGEPVNGATVDATTVVIAQGGVPVAGRYALATGARGPATVVTFTPNQALAPNTTYTVSVTTGIVDSAGNPLAAPFASSFTTGTALDNIPPTVTTLNPAGGATGVPVTFTPAVTFSEPMNPVSVNGSTLFLQGPEGAVAATLALSNGNTVATITPLNALFAGRQYSIFFQSGIADVAGNRLGNASFSTFTTAQAPGTANLPTGATVTINPASVFANGAIATTVIVSNVNRNSVVVPNGTLVAVTAQPAFVASAGGTISGASAGPSADPRFLLFSTLGGQITFSYTPPDLTSLKPSTTTSGVIQVASVDLDGRPVSLIAQGSASLFGVQSVTMTATPATLVANGTSTAAISATFRDKNGALVPDGTRIGLTAAPIFVTNSAGGTIVGGTTSAGDARVQIFTTTGGQISATYQSPTSKGSGSAAIQAVTVDAAGNPTGWIFPSTAITLQ